ncbi:MAG: hypothetical protein LBQ50_09755 [Planctomycetaceae bacterium]|nr:hypothetical protein [Planctomycetaceae bacterium]
MKNGISYTYFIRTVFKGTDGNSVLSTGKVVTAKPQLPPPAVTDIQASEQPDKTTLFSWTPPQQGEVFLFDLAKPPDVPVGDVIFTTPAHLQSRYGKPIPVLKQKDGQTIWKNTFTGVRHILPVTFQDGLAVYGQSVSIIQITDIYNLQVQITGTKLFLTWEWAKGLQKYWFSIGSTNFPNDPMIKKRHEKL